MKKLLFLILLMPFTAFADTPPDITQTQWNRLDTQCGYAGPGTEAFKHAKIKSCAALVHEERLDAIEAQPQPPAEIALKKWVLRDATGAEYGDRVYGDPTRARMVLFIQGLGYRTSFYLSEPDVLTSTPIYYDMPGCVGNAYLYSSALEWPPESHLSGTTVIPYLFEIAIDQDGNYYGVDTTQARAVITSASRFHPSFGCQDKIITITRWGGVPAIPIEIPPFTPPFTWTFE